MTLDVSTGAPLAVLLAPRAGVILDVLEDEISNGRRSRFWAFTAGRSVDAALLLAV